MAQNPPLQDHYAALRLTRPTKPEVLFLAFQIKMLLREKIIIVSRIWNLKGELRQSGKFELGWE
jgi:hypothetical protein